MLQSYEYFSFQVIYGACIFIIQKKMRNLQRFSNISNELTYTFK